MKRESGSLSFVINNWHDSAMREKVAANLFLYFSAVLGFEVTPGVIDDVWAVISKKFKQGKQPITIAYLRELLFSNFLHRHFHFFLKSMSVRCGHDEIPPTATVVLLHRSEAGVEEKQKIVFGKGPVDAVCQAINSITGICPAVMLFNVNAVTDNTESPAETTFVLRYGGREAIGTFSDPDTSLAAVMAYIIAINKFLA